MDYKNYKLNNKEDFCVRYKNSGDVMPYFHIHDDFEILLLLSKGAHCRIGDQIYQLAPNTVLLFNNMDLHWLDFDNPQDSERYYVFFKPSFLVDFSYSHTSLLDCFYFRPFEDPWVLPLSGEQALELARDFIALQDIQRMQPNDVYGRDLLLKLEFAKMLLKVNTIYRRAHQVAMDATVENYALVYKILDYLHQNLEEDLSLDKLSVRFFINKFTLCELFKKVTGTSPRQYILNCRIAKAKDLLSKGVRVDETCALSGFHNLSHFCRIFKERTGCSPRQFTENTVRQETHKFTGK